MTEDDLRAASTEALIAPLHARFDQIAVALPWPARLVLRLWVAVRRRS